MKQSTGEHRPGYLVLRTSGVLPEISVRLIKRTVLVCALLLCACLFLAVICLGIGDYPISPDETLAVLFGGGSPQAQLVVVEWRIPRVALALLLGFALGLSGAVFQSLTRNPLGSPDIIGFSTGSYTGGLIAILVLGGGYLTTAAGAVLGGLATAVVVYLLAYRNGVQGFRLIIVGIGVSATLASINTWLITRAHLDDAMQAAIWGSGSLNGLGYEQLWPVLALLAVCVPVLGAHAPALRQLELGDDRAAASGTRIELARLSAMLWGIILVAICTAAAGPIAFIALVAPQIARRLCASASISLFPAALTGCFLLLLSDLAAQRIFAPVQLPVGVMTVTLGGVYFVWLLIRERRTS